jgi:hypothetical protein
MNDDMLDPINNEDDEEQADVSEAADAADAETQAPEDAQEDSEGAAGDPPVAELPPWTPSAKLLEKLGELISNRQKIEQVRNQKKASNAAYKDREDALDARIGELTEQINEETWHEAFDAENGIVTRTNRLTGEVETRPYEPPRQAEIPFVDPRLANVLPGMYGEDSDGNHYVVERIDRDSVFVRYFDDGTRWVGVSAWPDYAPNADVDQAEYEQGFAEEQASWTSQVLEGIDEEGSTCRQVAETMMLEGEHHEARILAALDRLAANRAVRVTVRGDDRVYLLQDPDAPEINPILEHLTEQWEPVSDIATRAGLESKAAAKMLKIGIEEGQVEAEGEKRGRRYRKVS